jgi:hypothetical protein
VAHDAGELVEPVTFAFELAFPFEAVRDIPEGLC